MLKKALSFAVVTLSIATGRAQTTFLPLGSEDYRTLDRLETLSGRLCDSLVSGDKPESRRNAVHFLEHLKNKTTFCTDPSVVVPVDTLAPRAVYSKIDRYNLDQMISESGEWTLKGDGAIDSKKAWFKRFYQKQYNFFYIKTEDFVLDKDFFLVINPVTNNIAGMQQNSPNPAGINKTTLYSSRGAEVRLWIGKKVGFYSCFTDNQEQFPYYVSSTVSKKLQAVPGADYFKNPSKPNGQYDYMQASGYMNFDLVKNHLNITFGSGKHFLGDGFTSLLLTDNSSNMPFLQMQMRIWKLNYEALTLELMPQYTKDKDQVLPKKYSSIHYLTVNATRWLNIGLFEAEVFSRANQFELSYLNPFIVTTTINRYNGAGDKSLLGFTGKAIILKRMQLYGQFILNEFRIGELTSNKGWYGNKYGIQVGGKYFDAAGIRNLDLQAEVNAVRPYTYSSQDTFANYTNYNQPMADPLGAGFIKTIGEVRYQPMKNLYLTLRATYYTQGADTGNKNFGNNVFKNYTTAASTYGVSMVNGPKNTCKMVNLNISYQVRRNIFLDLGGTYRSYSSNAGIYPEYTTNGTITGPLTSTYMYFGLRVNAARRNYDLF